MIDPADSAGHHHEAEDEGEVIALNQSATVPFGDFTGPS
jgi:hypothetical protein